MAACFHIAGVQCDNCRTGLKDDRPYVAVVTTGGTYLSAQDFLTALRQVEIERDEARGEVDRLRGLLREAHRELVTIEAITVSPSDTDGLIDLCRRMRAATGGTD
jgi:hypothetical protein